MLARSFFRAVWRHNGRATHDGRLTARLVSVVAGAGGGGSDARRSASLLAVLKQRQLVFDATSPEIERHLESGSASVTRETAGLTENGESSSQQYKGSVYCGYDPTASSLHCGNLVTAAVLRHFQLAGWRPVIVLGGATGLVGDPSGRTTERPLLDLELVRANTQRIGESLRSLFRPLPLHSNNDHNRATSTAPSSFNMPEPIVVNNIDWFHEVRVLEFLREIGKHFTMAQLLGKHSVKSRAEHGLSFTEFSYQLLQATDFLRLYENHHCTVQIGGSDQWGNITSGIHLINRLHGHADHRLPIDDAASSNDTPLAFGLTIPLLTTSTGEKIGKSAGNAAVWLNQDMTSHFDFYQYFVRVSDDDVARFLRAFTFLPLEEIDTILEQHAKAPEQRYAQRLLAEHVTTWVRGEEATAIAQDASKALYSDADVDYSQLSHDSIRAMFKNAPSSTIPRHQVVGQSIVNLLASTGLLGSKGEARRIIENGGAYVNKRRVTNIKDTVQEQDVVGESIVILRTGKKSHHVVYVT